MDVDDDYRPFDQHEKLPPSPWRPSQLVAWEAAHGHDVRIKCLPEFGCLVIEAFLERQSRDTNRRNRELAADNAKLRDTLKRLRDEPDE